MDFIGGNGYSWKGLLWFFWIVWPIAGVELVIEHFNNQSEFTILIRTVIILIWIVWLIPGKRVVEFLVDLFKKH